MRLIDADKLDEYLDVDLSTGDERVTISWVKSWLGLQPTAYDIDKVVGELNKEAARYNDWALQALENGFPSTYEANFNKMYGIYDAIEIVKGGAE